MLPGRLRLEIAELVNQRYRCRALKLKLLEINGVLQAEANHRTGRLLVVFDEALLGACELLLRIERILAEKVEDTHNEYQLRGEAGSKILAGSLVHAVLDMAGQMLIPKPFNRLLPLAANVMRKNA
jgi:hypothetical protein